MEERDEKMFYTYLRAFRDNLKRYHLDTLLDYFDTFYFQPERIRQWASWYRLQMFKCEWLLDTNMHVEAWHNILKTHIMDRAVNTRIEKLMTILRTAETMYFWKWSRTQLGARELSDEKWQVMHGGASDTRTP